MLKFTNAMEVPFSFAIKDGFGKPAKIDGEPVAASSDETVAVVSPLTKADDRWNGVLTAVAPSPAGETQRMTVSADADLGAGVRPIVGILEFQVILDERGDALVVEIEAGQPRDKA